MLAFAHPGVLWLLPLAAVPLLIHLLGRDRPPRLVFPTLRFLRPTPAAVQGRRRWQDVLLMVVRMALLAVLCLLAAGPLLPPKASVDNAAGASIRRGVAILLDDSASMRGNRGPLLEECRALREQIGVGDCVVWRMGSCGEESPADAEWTGGWSAGRPGLALEAASEWLSRYPVEGRELHVFSDFQESDWDSVEGALPPGTRLVLHAPASPVSENCGVMRVGVRSAAGGRLRVQAHLRHWGDAPVVREAVLSLGGRELRQSVELPAAGEAVAVFLVEPGEDARGELRLEPGDGFDFDDRRTFWARIPPPRQLAAVVPGPEDGTVGEELAFFCTPAFTAEPPESIPRFAIETLGVESLPLLDLEELSAVLLLGTAERLLPGELLRLREYVESGGVLVSVPGVAPLLGWRQLQDAGLAPEGLGEVVTRRTGIGELPAGSPLANLFPPQEPSDLHLFAIHRHLKISLAPGDGQIVLSTLEGDPALVKRTLGRGQCLLFAFGFHSADSNFPLSRSFVPLCRELLEGAVPEDSGRLRLSCGEGAPDGWEEVSPEAFQEPGLLEHAGRLVEVWTPAGESVPRYLPVEDVRRALLMHRGDDAGVGGRTNELAPRGRSLQAHVLAALILLLLGEALLADWGRRAPSSSKT